MNYGRNYNTHNLGIVEGNTKKHLSDIYTIFSLTLQ